MNKSVMSSPYTKNLNSVAVDYDGTITKSNGRINRKAVKYLKKIQSLGIQLILWTCRKDNRLNYAYKNCLRLGLNVQLPSATGKIDCLYYIDDRSVPNGKINWLRTYLCIKTLKIKLKNI